MLFGLHEQSLRLEPGFVRRLADKVNVFSRLQFEILTFRQLQPMENRQVHLKNKTSDRCIGIVAWSCHSLFSMNRHALFHGGRNPLPDVEPLSFPEPSRGNPRQLP